MSGLLNPCNATLIEFVKKGRIKENGHPENRTWPLVLIHVYTMTSINNYYACLLVRGFLNMGLTPKLVKFLRLIRLKY